MKIKKKNFYIGIAAVIMLAAAAYYWPILGQKNQDDDLKNEPDRIEWLVDKDGYLYYPSDRGDVKFNRQDYGADGNLSIHKVVYPSRSSNIYGLLVLPASAEELLPGIVLLPGAGVSKESELGLAKSIAGLGAVVLVIDQRGTGETTVQ